MAYSLHLFAKAEADCNEAVEGYKGQSADAAVRFLQEVSEVLEALETHPHYYSYYIQPYRRVLLKSFPYRIVYKINGDKVLIYGVYHNRSKRG